MAVLAVYALVGAKVSTVTVTSCVFQNNCNSSNPGNIVTIPVSNRDKVSTSYSTKTSVKVDPLDAAQATSPGSSQIPTTTSNTDADNLLLATGVVTESSTAGSSGETIIVYTSRYTSTVTSPRTVTSLSASEASVPEIHTVYLPQPTVTLAASTVTVEPATVTIVQESLITSVLEHKSTETPSFTTISQLSEPTESYSTLSEQPTVTVTANVLTVTPTVTSSRTLQGHNTPTTKCPSQSVESESSPSISLCYRPLPIPPKGNCHDHGDRPLRGDCYDCDYRDSRDDCQNYEDKCPDRNDNAHHCEPECRRRAHYGGRYHVKGGRARHLGNCHRRN